MQAGIERLLAEAKLRRRHPHYRRRQRQSRQQRNSRVTASGAISATCVLKTKKVLAALRELGVELKSDASLTEITYLGIGGTTDLLRMTHHESIPEVVNLLDANGIPFKFLGGGSNLLVADSELPWVVMQLAQPDPDVVIEGNFATVDAAADLGRTVTLCAKHDLGGMEGLIGVPGTVGGALRMNAGAYGIQIGNYVREVKVYRAARRIIEIFEGRSNFLRIPAYIFCAR